MLVYVYINEDPGIIINKPMSVPRVDKLVYQRECFISRLGREKKTRLMTLETTFRRVHYEAIACHRIISYETFQTG